MTLIKSITSRFIGSTSVEPKDCMLVVGLGNPGTRYEATRHNVGFLAISALAAEIAADNWRSRFDSMIAEKKVPLAEGQKLMILAKPQTMMNRSGRAVKGILKQYQLEPEQLCVIHDDIDLPAGTLRVKSGGGHGGHNGMRDVIEAVGQDFTRIKVGVGSPPGRMDSADYVLQQVKGALLEELTVDAARAAEIALYLFEHDLVSTQNRYN